MVKVSAMEAIYTFTLMFGIINSRARPQQDI